MVAHTGFEPVVFALRGRCPRPLDECAWPCAEPELANPHLTVYTRAVWYVKLGASVRIPLSTASWLSPRL